MTGRLTHRARPAHRPQPALARRRGAVAWIVDRERAVGPLSTVDIANGTPPGSTRVAEGAVLAWLSLWSRRAELAVYRTFGSTRCEVAFLVLVELGLVLLPATVAGATVGLGVLAWQSEALPRPATVETLAATGTTLAAGALLGLALGSGSALLVARGNLHEQLKDR